MAIEQNNQFFPQPAIPANLPHSLGNAYPVNPNQAHIEIPLGIPIHMNNENIHPPLSIQGVDPRAPVKQN
eukprot:CAMPEP_0205826702 /NCGR_PEP_ID=MMETSP0206-20130828/29595_1 /ASSEMBLY_ACC=CAM_ASM_000279 /TAXON_ID=36767 /ORGANISM="Euplotes focardii, Strain TN1" /LENGTH=69 /DNA_ID=CAMNT_0053126875 /DNA_START=838 /DNA_END=1047 /DNA_ORIENTATION=+